MIRHACILTLAGLAALAHAKDVRWVKGNTHTHSYWSDGNAPPEHIADWYVRNGYDFLVLSDHNTLQQGDKWFPISTEGGRPLTPDFVERLRQRFGDDWVVTRERDGRQEMKLKTLPELRAKFESPDEFLFIQGEEITDRFERHEIHINAINLEAEIAPRHGESIQDTIQRNLDAVIEHGRKTGRPVLAHINHPNFRHSLLPEHLAHMKGERFFEVYNGHRGVINHGDETCVSTENIWDEALYLRLTRLDLGLLYALAVDDSHDHHGVRAGSTPGRGWVQVRTDALDEDAIVQAMRDGDFYASNGVTLLDVRHDADHLAIDIDAEEGVTYTTEFIGVKDGVPGRILETSTSDRPVYRFEGDEVYVRARVISDRLHPNPFAEGDLETAWVQPVIPGD